MFRTRSSAPVTAVRLAEAASPRYARLVLQLPGSGEELEMDLLKEALEPRWVTVQVTPATSVRAVSLEDRQAVQQHPQVSGRKPV